MIFYSYFTCRIEQTGFRIVSLLMAVRIKINKIEKIIL